MLELERRVAAAEEGEEKKKMDKELTFKRANRELAGAKYVRIYQCHPSNILPVYTKTYGLMSKRK